MTTLLVLASAACTRDFDGLFAEGSSGTSGTSGATADASAACTCNECTTTTCLLACPSGCSSCDCGTKLVKDGSITCAAGATCVISCQDPAICDVTCEQGTTRCVCTGTGCNMKCLGGAKASCDDRVAHVCGCP